MPRAAKTKTEKETKETTEKVVSEAPKKTVRKENDFSIAVYGADGKEVKNIQLAENIFNTKVNKNLLAQYVRMYLANQRQGTASTKTRGEVIGSTKKIYRQKGTGKARHGANKAPIFVGGGVTHAPKPRDYSLKMNKKQRTIALASALTVKAKEAAIFGLANDMLEMETKTKTFAQALKAMGADKKNILIVLPELNKNGLVLSARNVANVELTAVSNLNPYTILHHNTIAFVENALDTLVDHFFKA